MNKQALEITEKVHALFRTRGITLSVAESCTGGLISNYITSLPGASYFFEAGVVSYSAVAKEKILGVSPETIAAYGVVSEQTGREMAENIRKLAGTDFALSTTGNLGPEVLEGKALGLVYIAVGREGETCSRELHLKGSREENKEYASLSALEFLIEIAEQ